MYLNIHVCLITFWNLPRPISHQNFFFLVDFNCQCYCWYILFLLETFWSDTANQSDNWVIFLHSEAQRQKRSQKDDCYMKCGRKMELMNFFAYVRVLFYSCGTYWLWEGTYTTRRCKFGRVLFILSPHS